MVKSNKKPKEIYMDYAASVEPNAGSIHSVGVKMKKNLEDARVSVAKVLHTSPKEVIFTSGGTESNNLAIQGAVFAFRENNKSIVPHIVTTNIEHSSVLETVRLLARRGLAEVSIVPVEGNGIVDPKKIKKEIKDNTILVSVMYANNEIGTIQPIKEIAKEIRHYKKTTSKYNIYFHTDAVQAVNYLDLNVEKLGVDMLSLSGAKILSAGRVGVLYKKRSVVLSPIMAGGDQEYGLRPGTENVGEVVKFAKALERMEKGKEKESKRINILRDYFLNKLQHSDILKNIGMLVNGDLENRLPNNINITFPKIPSDLLVIELSAKGVMASSKSACKSSGDEGSYVIAAIHPETPSDIGGLRFSMGGDITKKEIDYTLKALSQILLKLKKWYT